MIQSDKIEFKHFKSQIDYIKFDVDAITDANSN